MATISATSPKPAPWKATFAKHLAAMDSPEFVLATLSPQSKDSTASHAPRARFCIHRGFFAELEVNEKSTAKQNPKVYETDMVTFTTDVRMNKVPQLFGSAVAGGSDWAQGSGGGGPVEAVWWVKANDIMTQWRIIGEAYILGPDIDSNEESSGVRTVKAELGKRMHVIDEEKKADWSWSREVTAQYGNLSPMMRGSFKAPPPGTDVNKPYDEEKYQLGTKVDDLEHSVARSNFRVVVIKPNTVEMMPVNGKPEPRRYIYNYVESDGSWTETVTWP